MMRRVSPEEEEERDKRIAELSSSVNIEDRLCAILMDTCIGDFGLHEDVAREKTRHVISHLIGGLGKIPL